MNPVAFWKRAEAAAHGYQSVMTSLEKNFEPLAEIFAAYGIQVDLEAMERRLIFGFTGCRAEAVVGDPQQNVTAREHGTIGRRQLDADLVLAVVRAPTDRVPPRRPVGERLDRGVHLYRPVGRRGHEIEFGELGVRRQLDDQSDTGLQPGEVRSLVLIGPPHRRLVVVGDQRQEIVVLALVSLRVKACDAHDLGRHQLLEIRERCPAGGNARIIGAGWSEPSWETDGRSRNQHCRDHQPHPEQHHHERGQEPAAHGRLVIGIVDRLVDVGCGRAGRQRPLLGGSRLLVGSGRLAKIDGRPVGPDHNGDVDLRRIGQARERCPEVDRALEPVGRLTLQQPMDDSDQSVARIGAEVGERR